MKTMAMNDEANINVRSELVQRSNQEKIATAAITTETLSKLNVSIDALPQKCQNLLHQTAQLQAAMDFEHLDPIGLCLIQSRYRADDLEDEYEILKLKQKNTELQARINRNNKFLQDLRAELDNSRRSLSAQTPNPDSIHDIIRQMRHKVASYEESCSKAKARFTKLSVPESLYPNSLMSLIDTLARLQVEASSLKQRADDIALAREARDAFNKLRR